MVCLALSILFCIPHYDTFGKVSVGDNKLEFIFGRWSHIAGR